jgi:hypothetical protein
MRRTTLAVMTVGLAQACQRAPERPPAVAQAQAELTPDTAQARLWTEAATAGTGPAAAGLRVDSGAVRRRTAVRIPDRPIAQREQAFPQEVPAAVALLAVPELAEPFSGTATVGAIRGEVLTLDLGQGRVLQLQAKVGGAPLRAAAGESARLFYRGSGDPFLRNDVLDLQLPNDRLVYALVGAAAPVRLEIPSAGIQAAQIDRPDSNMMAVAVTLRSERRTLRPGEQAEFPGAGLTVRLLASVAVQGEAAHAVEGDPYRIELLAWRTRGER